MTRKSWEELSKKEKYYTMESMKLLYGDSTKVSELPIRPIKKKRKPKTYIEYQIQCEIVSWCRKNSILAYSNRNERKQSVIGGVRDKASGTLAGVSDLFIAEPRGEYCGYYIELKSPGKKPTDQQIWFIGEAKKRRYKAEWFDSSEKAIESIKEYMGSHDVVHTGCMSELYAN